MLNAWHLPVPPFIQTRKDKLSITLWVSGEDLPHRVVLRYEKDNEETSVQMTRQKAAPGDGIVAWRGVIDLSEGQPRRRYSFKMLWLDKQCWLTPQGLRSIPPARLEQFAVDLPDDGPQWVQDQIFYQIFPDRFARSEQRAPEQDQIYYHHAAKRDIILRDWNEPLLADAGGSTFYGGDLDGISENLPYLKKLGVTALYLNPIFTAPSVHKYDTQDYRHVDVQFGGDHAFLRLRKNTQRLGMRLMLDGVFNHSGDTHQWFDRQQTHGSGASHNPQSPWRDFYSYNQDGRALDWLGYSSLPKLDYQSSTLVNEIYQGEESVVRHWLREPWGIDGWRLDVVHMLGEAGGAKNNLLHVAGITRAAKETQSDAYVLGEHFGDARQWLQTDAEDAAMNYRGFTFPLWGFLANTDISYDPQHIEAQTCMAWMDEYRAGLSHQQQLRMFNQLDSHDTARFKSILGKDVGRLPLAVVWLYCWPGVPCVYYGDEVGLDGNNDPFCRKPFPWNKDQQDLGLLALYQRLGQLRHKSRALRHGGCQVIYAQGDVVIFVRVWQNERVLVALNRGEETALTLPWDPLLTDKDWTRLEGKAKFDNRELSLPAVSVALWRSL